MLAGLRRSFAGIGRRNRLASSDTDLNVSDYSGK